MINALHLIWIIPKAATFGFFVAAVLAADRQPGNAQNAAAYKPKNCWECEHSGRCNTAYGWSGCKYKDAITRDTIHRTLGEDKKGEESV